jgi:hypothetical protein
VLTKISPTPRFASEKLVKIEAKNPFTEIEPSRHICRIAVHVKRDPILLDFFQKIEKFTKGEIIIQTHTIRRVLT